MRKKLIIGCLVFMCFVSSQAQEKSDREKMGLSGYVKSTREESAEIIFRNNKPIERNRVLEEIITFDISGRKITDFVYTNEGKVLYRDFYFYDKNGKLIETKTEHGKFLYLCDKKTYVYDLTGRLSEELCHLEDKGIIGKTVYRYNSDGKLFEQERFPLVEAKLYFRETSLKRYKYKLTGELDEVSTYVKENDEWKLENDGFGNAKSSFFSNEISRISSELRFDVNGKVTSVLNSLEDEKGNEIETIKYFPDGATKEGSRYEYKFDKEGNIIKEIDFEWTTEDGKSSFKATNVSHYKIEYFNSKEIREFKALRPKIKAIEKQLNKTIDKDEYSVYDTMLEQWKVNGKIKKIVVKEFTTVDNNNSEKPLTIDCFLHSLGKEPALEQSIVNDFNEKNFRQSSQLFQGEFGAKNKVVLLSDSQVSEIFNKGCEIGWKRLAKKYPNLQGLTTFSRVGFNKDKTLAIVYIGHSFACLGGAGNFVILQKNAEGWKIIETNMLWIS